jgi:hypothetical protein
MMAEPAAATTATAASTAQTAASPVPAASSAPQPRAGVIEDRVYDGLPEDKKAGFARVKRAGDQSGSEWVDRAALEASSTTNTTAATAGDGKASVTADGRLQVGEMLLTEADIKSLITEKAAADLRKAQVPATAEAYAADLPADFKLPEGMQWQWKTDDPSYIDARNWAFSQGLTQPQWSQLLSFHASTQIREQQMIGNAAAAELAKLGANATARVTAVDTWLRGTLGDNLGGAVRQMMLTAKMVEGMEKLMTKMSTQGHASFRQDGREPGSAPGRVSEAEYDAMTPGERYAYSKGFDQKQFR